MDSVACRVLCSCLHLVGYLSQVNRWKLLFANSVKLIYLLPTLNFSAASCTEWMSSNSMRLMLKIFFRGFLFSFDELFGLKTVFQCQSFYYMCRQFCRHFTPHNATLVTGNVHFSSSDTFSISVISPLLQVSNLWNSEKKRDLIWFIDQKFVLLISEF